MTTLELGVLVSTPASATERGVAAVRRLPRIAIVGIAIVAALLVFGVASIITDVRTPAMNGRASQDLNALFVILMSGVPALLGWGLLALLEKFTAKAVIVWRIIAAVVLLLSLAGPFTGTSITTDNRLWLAAMHVTVGVVLIGLLPGAGKRKTP